LFIGNSFTYGAGSDVHHYRPETVTDVNGEGVGGVPALFESFTEQAGLDYDVYLETRGGSGFEFHLDDKLDVIGTRRWDKVVMQGQSTLDLQRPGDPTKLLETSVRLSEVIHDRNPDVEIYFMATWSRADQTYPSAGAWYGQPIDRMARDVRAAYDEAARRAPGARAVLPVGEAWNRAMEAGVADPNPYDGLEPGRLDLWGDDHYHASSFGYYLEALVVFGVLTRRDPRSLGDGECSAHELGFSTAQAKALQQIAFEQLSREPGLPLTPSAPHPPRAAGPCVRAG
jgi:hypothetical protein